MASSLYTLLANIWSTNEGVLVWVTPEVRPVSATVDSTYHPFTETTSPDQTFPPYE